jgi:hypothetical protein
LNGPAIRDLESAAPAKAREPDDDETTGVPRVGVPGEAPAPGEAVRRTGSSKAR